MSHSSIRYGLFLAAIAAGCAPSSNPIAGTDWIAEFAPTSKPPIDGTLQLPGANIPVAVESTRQGEFFTIQVTAYGEVLETERYRLHDGQFALTEALGETYSPEAPLLGKGTNSDTVWKWSGKIRSGGIDRKAAGEIFGKEIALELVGYKGPGRLVTMDLEIESGERVLAERRLSFFFAKGKGLLKREFGQASTRMPAEPEAESGR